MVNNELEKSHYEATVRREEMRWKAMYDFVLHSDRAAIDIGITGLKTAVLINAGSLVALLALIGQLWGKEDGKVFVSHVLSGSLPFVLGLVIASIDFVIAYFYQSAVTGEVRHKMDKLYEQQGKPVADIPHLTRFRFVSAIVMVLLAVLSLVSFVWGILSVVCVFKAGV